MSSFTWGDSTTWGKDATWGEGVPYPPENVALSEPDGYSITVSWDNVGNADATEVQRALADGSPDWTTVATVQRPVSNYLDDEPKIDNEQYRYRVVAVNEYGSSEPSPDALSDPIPTPSIEGDDITVGLDGRSVTLTWNEKSNNATEYDVYLRESDGVPDATEAATGRGDERSVTVSGLLDGERYEATVDTVSDETEFTPTVSATGGFSDTLAEPSYTVTITDQRFTS